MNSWLRTQAEKNPEKLFVQQGENQFTFGDIYDTVLVFAKSLLKNDLTFNDKVVIFLPTGVDTVEMILACFEIGVIAVPLSIKLTEQELDVLLNQIQPTLIITNWANKKRFNKFSNCTHIYIEEVISSSDGCGITEISNRSTQDDVCAILLTSGTTDLPKAVQLTYKNFEASCENWHDYLGFKDDDQFLCCLPLNHIGGLAVIIRALIYGFSINLVNSFNAEVIFNAFTHYPVTIVSLVPTLLKRILELPGAEFRLKSMRYILLGGGPASDRLLLKCIHDKINIIKTYGMTETCSGIVGLSILNEPENRQYAGRPFKDVNLNIENGTILITGPMVMKGYLGNPIANGSHDSKDLGRIKNDILYLDCRRKDLIISGGENVNPREVESVIQSFPNISDAAVTGLKDDEWGQRVVAFVVSKNEVDTEKLGEFCREKLSDFKCPKDIIQLDEIPRTVIGKVDLPKLTGYIKGF